ncbi:hypothetical protein [Nonomuraea sp. JJY05]|uniref:hypothetical protein n=1 Tax=Nonomuraea sp. JJY05 TaxID=3350255 RepID=UPI00373F380A
MSVLARRALLDFPAEYFAPPPEPPAPASPASPEPPAATAEPPLIEQITQAVRDLAERQSAVVADLEARVESAPEAARQSLADTANFHRSTIPNITAVADHLAQNPEPALAEADALVVGGGNTHAPLGIPGPCKG